MIDFSDLHIIFWLFILAFCIVYNLTMNSEIENVRKKVLNWQSFFLNHNLLNNLTCNFAFLPSTTLN